jgi:hypothetical protein
MMQAKHFASDNIKTQLDKLQIELHQLQELTMERKVKLQASLESQTVGLSLFSGDHFWESLFQILMSEHFCKNVL